MSRGSVHNLSRCWYFLWPFTVLHAVTFCFSPSPSSSSSVSSSSFFASLFFHLRLPPSKRYSPDNVMPCDLLYMCLSARPIRIQQAAAIIKTIVWRPRRCKFLQTYPHCKCNSDCTDVHYLLLTISCHMLEGVLEWLCTP